MEFTGQTKLTKTKTSKIDLPLKPLLVLDRFEEMINVIKKGGNL